MLERPASKRAVALLSGAAALVLLAACQPKDVRLPGERLDVRAVMSPDGPAVEGDALASGTALSLPPIQSRNDWPQRAGGADHNKPHAALPGGASRVLWATSIGAGEGRKHRITAVPVVAGGVIYTLDSRARVAATSVTGAPLWASDVTPALETGDSVSGGGLAYGDGRVYVTTGYGEAVALDAASGAVLWRQRVGAPIGGAPTYADGTVYVAGRNANGWAIRATDGKLAWQIGGSGGTAGVMGVSSPAVSGELVMFPFASGQLLAVDRESGIERWSAQVAGTRIGSAFANIRDMTGDPVISGSNVIAGTSSGRIAALGLADGMAMWSAREGAMNPVQTAGGDVFAVTDDFALVRLDGANGGVVWRADLPGFVDEKTRKLDRIWPQFGPVLASGRLYVAGADAVLRSFDPASGALLSQTGLPAGAATAPVIAGGVMYLTLADGRLVALK